jgi:hypothetical protein
MRLAGKQRAARPGQQRAARPGSKGRFADTSSLSYTPDGWCLRNTSTCGQFYGEVTSSDSNAVMWQWSSDGATFNGFGDFDQIDANRTP